MAGLHRRHLPLLPSGQENLCDHPGFTGYSSMAAMRTHTLADARYAFPLPELYSDAEAAPLLCAGLIGYRTLKLAREAQAR